MKRFVKWLFSLFLIMLSGHLTAQHSLDFFIPPCPHVNVEDPGLMSPAIYLFPQPAARELTVKVDHLGLHCTDDAELIMYDMMGRLVTKKTIPKGTRITRLNVSDLPSGIYLLQIQIGQKLYNDKIIITKE